MINPPPMLERFSAGGLDSANSKTNLMEELTAKKEQILHDCAAEIQAVLTRYSCRFELYLTISSSGAVTPRIEILFNNT